MAGLDAVSSLSSATPWGAGLSAVGAIASTPNTSATGDVSTGAINIGGLDFGGDDDRLLKYLVLGLAGLGGLLVLANVMRR